MNAGKDRDDMSETERVQFFGGPVDGARAELSRQPTWVEVLGLRYERLDDPDTGEPLGGYALTTTPAGDSGGERG